LIVFDTKHLYDLPHYNHYREALYDNGSENIGSIRSKEYSAIEKFPFTISILTTAEKTPIKTGIHLWSYLKKKVSALNSLCGCHLI